MPLLALLLYGRRSEPRVWGSAALAVCGTFCIGYDGGPPNVGDAWCVAAALASAGFILRLEAASAAEPPPLPAALNAATLACAASYFSLWAAADAALGDGGGGVERTLETLGEQLPVVLYLSAVVSTLANYLQTLGQSRVSAADAAVIYALDPVYGALFSYALLGETLGGQVVMA